MASGGGSLVVEERFQPRMFHVHWAGSRTSEGSADCGSSAELVLPAADLQLLSNTVGGAGVEHRAFGDSDQPGLSCHCEERSDAAISMGIASLRSQ